MEFVFNRKKLGWIAGILLALAFSKAGLGADATSFDPTTIAVTSQSTIAVGTVIVWPSGSNPADMAKWLECNGQPVPAGSNYDRLRTLVGTTVPNYNGQFLRGTLNCSLVGQQVADTIGTHSTWVPSVAVTGTASGQSITNGGASSQHFDSWGGQVNYSYSVTENGFNGVYQGGFSAGGVNWTNRYMTSGSTGSVHIWGDTQGGSIWGSTGGGSITGVTTGQTITYNGTETAPVHTKVRYLIRAIQ